MADDTADLSAEAARLGELQVIEGGAEGDAPLSVRRPSVRTCSHFRRGFVLEPDLRQVCCKGCGAAIDPFTVLEQLAREPERYAAHLRRTRADAARAAEELERVKRELRNAKARLRTARRQQP